MQDDTLPLNNSNATTTPLSTRLPFTKYDFGWVLLCIGMAIGAGTVLMPVQIGLKGIWVFITAFIIAYPATYIVQDIYLKTLSESETCDDYTDIISHYLGKNWGVFLGVIYFLMIIHGVFIYSLSVVFDSASYIKTFGLTEADLSQSIIYKVAIFAVLVAIASGGEKLLFKISGPMVVVKVGIILIFGFAMIPFCFFSAVFIQVLNPMNIAYRKREPDRVLATRMAIRTHRISYITLIAIILFFSFSFTFSISHEEAVSAFEQNISALALAAQVIPGHIIHITSTILNIFAVLTAFFGIYLGFHEALKGIVLNILSRIMDVKNVNPLLLTSGICVFIVVTLVIWVSFRVSVLVFFQLGSPLYGIVACIIPFFLIYKVAQLEKLRGLKTWLILLYGILLCLSPLLKLIE
ncbi:transporter [Salmonella enterica]|nr:transporter [Salmonella enterica]ECH0471939.1 transporter [Salmonella enterica]ECT9576831.1 transporter [Salmonella enterica]ECU5209147.1 transporter [Salmonella enterica]EFR5002144.1 transporter [Salmonella enterica]